METCSKKFSPEKMILKSLRWRHTEAQVILERLERMSNQFTPAIGEENLGKLMRTAIYHSRCLVQDLEFCLDVCTEKEIEEEEAWQKQRKFNKESRRP